MDFAKILTYEVSCAKWCIALSCGYWLMHQAIFKSSSLTHKAFPTGKPEEVFYQPTSRLQRIIGSGFWNFLSSSPSSWESFICRLLSLLVQTRRLACSQLATGKLCTCLALNHLFLEGWAQHLKCHQATSQLMECLGDTPRTKFPSQSWAILGSYSPLPLTRREAK